MSKPLYIVYCETGMVVGCRVSYPNPSFITVDVPFFITKDKEQEKKGNLVFKFTSPPLMLPASTIDIPYSVIHFIAPLDPETSVYKQYMEFMETESEKFISGIHKKNEADNVKAGRKRGGKQTQIMNLSPHIISAQS